jgi:hypothetical protein
MGEKKIDLENQMLTGQMPDFSTVEPKLIHFGDLITAAAIELKRHTSHLKPSEDALNWWNNIIEEWIRTNDVPLFIRKTNDQFPRGSEIKHKSGRVLIPCDNGPAHWSFSMCANGNLPTLAEIRNFILNDQIPVAMVLKGIEKKSRYRCTQHQIDQPNEKGWKIAHKVAIGLNTRTPLDQIEMTTLENHFRRFMNPSNMFVVPLKYSGLAEIDDVIGIFSSRDSKKHE